MGVILVVMRDNHMCTLETSIDQWSVKHNYYAELVTFRYQLRQYSLSLLEFGLNYYLTIRVSFTDISCSDHLMTGSNYSELTRTNRMIYLLRRKLKKLQHLVLWNLT